MSRDGIFDLDKGGALPPRSYDAWMPWIATALGWAFSMCLFLCIFVGLFLWAARWGHRQNDARSGE